MPEREEVRAAMDALWNNDFIRREFEEQERERARKMPRWIVRLIRRRSEIHLNGNGRHNFDNELERGIRAALEAAEQVRAGKTVEEVFKPAIHIIWIGDVYTIEVRMKRDGPTEFVGEFVSYVDAKGWLLKEGQKYLREHGLKPGIEPIVIGDSWLGSWIAKNTLSI